MPIGQVFTPPALAAEILAAVPGRPARVLDPACGDGNFLAAARDRWPDAELVGYEEDAVAAARARERLPGARIEVADALTLPVEPAFDLVAGNPPYAAAFRDGGDRARVRAEHRTVRGSYDLAVPFIERAVGWLRPGGWLAMVVTNKILVKDYAALLRDWLLASLAIEEVWDLAASPAFPGAAIDVAVLIGRRAAREGPTRVVLGRRDGSRESYPAARLPRGPRGRWEVYVTPFIAPVVEAIERHPRLGGLPGVAVRDGVLGREYHTVPIREAAQSNPLAGEYPVVGVGRVGAGIILWDRPLKRGGERFANPVMPVDGAFGEFCRSPKVLVRGVARRLVAAYAPQPAVPSVAVRAVTGFPEPERLVSWLNDPLATFYLQATCRGDRIPAGSYNVSKAWLEALPVPREDARPPEQDARAIEDWLKAFGV